MPKLIQIEARTRTGERGVVEKLYPLNLAEAVAMWGGEQEVFKLAVQSKIIVDQREARPEKMAAENGEEPKPKKRLSVFDRLNQD
jgi:hypothetical protein